MFFWNQNDFSAKMKGFSFAFKVNSSRFSCPWLVFWSWKIILTTIFFLENQISTNTMRSPPSLWPKWFIKLCHILWPISFSAGPNVNRWLHDCWHATETHTAIKQEKKDRKKCIIMPCWGCFCSSRDSLITCQITLYSRCLKVVFLWWHARKFALLWKL